VEESKVEVTVDRRADDEDDKNDDGENDETFLPPEERTSSATEAPNLIMFGRNAFGCDFVSLGRSRWLITILFMAKNAIPLERKDLLMVDGAEVHVICSPPIQPALPALKISTLVEGGVDG
jgi:hypothetical protein